MQHRCPACERSFDEPGFCPFDRTRLVASSASVATPDQPTIHSGQLPAEDPHKTELEPKRTFPLTPAPNTQDETHEILEQGTRPGHATPLGEDAPRLRAMSASENPAAVLETYRKRADDYDKLVGQTLDGRYFVERKIGEGGMGVVFAARHAVIERPLAIKVLKREVMRDTATIRRFVQEAQAASRIGHPNIVDVTDFGTTPDGMTYSVMEFVTGQTLGAALRDGAPFAPSRAIKIAVQIARALGAAHDKGIVHRDLKPENVFLIDRDNRTDFVKIVDFGIAKVTPAQGVDPNAPRLTRAGSVFGTPEYMAPEQAAGRGDTDGRVDIYALGVILYEMITGRVPHRGDSTVRTLAMQMLEPAVPPSQARPDLAISPELEAVILRALAKKREARYQTMGALIDAVEGLQTQVGVSVTGSPIYALPEPAVVLPALPPGADRAALPPSTPPSTPPGTPPEPAVPTARRLRDEPEFVTRDKPATFEHVFTEEVAAPPRRRWPLLLLGVLIVGGAIGAIALVLESRSRVLDERTAGDPEAPPADALEVAIVPDAEVIAPVPEDARAVVRVEPDAGVRARPPRRGDAGVVAMVRPGRGIAIQVITRPEGANLYVGHTYRGPGGTTIEEPHGTRLDVQCRLRGYKPGTISLVFDGKTEFALCVLERIKICIDGIKNPFDECEPAP